jgi:regulator of protease activity HflC (stomatin/prohibitin superfamily)
MRKFLPVLFALGLFGCDRVESGYVGLKVNLLGGEKGDIEVLPMGRYWIGMNEELHLFPVFKQNYTWAQKADEVGEGDESISFQTVEGMEVSADVGISFEFQADKIPTIFQTYRRGVREITDTFLRNHVRDAMNSVGSKLPVESVYGNGKSEFLDAVEKEVKDQVSPLGIIVEKVYLIGSFRLPAQIVEALNAKMGASQKAQQRQNEVAESKAEADKSIEKARGQAESQRMLAEAEANANKIVAASISDELVRYEHVKKWNGVLPTTILGGDSNVLLGVK